MGEDSKKPGPDPERLVIEGDPEEALDRLLGKSGGVTGIKRFMHYVRKELPAAEFHWSGGRFQVTVLAPHDRYVAHPRWLTPEAAEQASEAEARAIARELVELVDSL